MKTSMMLCEILVRALSQSPKDQGELMMRGETVVRADTDGYSVRATLANGTKIRISPEQEVSK